jgi:uncharacterized membrane protein YbhN (UPF0104 family)
MMANQGTLLEKDKTDRVDADGLDIDAESLAHMESQLNTDSKTRQFSVTAAINSIKISERTKLRAKIAVSVVLFASLFLFGKVDLSKSIEVAVKANPWYLLAAFALFLGSTFLNAYRWKLLASAAGLNQTLLKMVQFCFVGVFFNLFLPSTVGGDFSRCYYLSKGTGKYAHAFYSVLADRTVELLCFSFSPHWEYCLGLAAVVCLYSSNCLFCWAQ